MKSVTAMAPALMKGLRGRPASASSWTMELKAVPEGSRPTRRQTASPWRSSASTSAKTLLTDWMEKRVSASPAKCSMPSAVMTAMPNWWGLTLDSSGM
jgi:hypothetical protein